MKVKLAGYIALLSLALSAQNPSEGARANMDSGVYRLAPDDQVAIRVADLEKLQLENSAAPKVDVDGNLNLPIIGRVHAAGLTLSELEAQIKQQLSSILQNPQVSVSILQYRNHPVSVFGAVKSPGVIQVTGERRLLEVLSLAGGLSPEAGDKIVISRPLSSGKLPLLSAELSATSDSYVGTVYVQALMEANHPEINIEVRENDVITVAKARLVYVLGAVKKAGGFSLGERSKISVLQALALAEGLDAAAAPRSARLIRPAGPNQEKTEISVNLKPIMKGAAPDVPLGADDILFVPTNATRWMTMRSLDAAINLGTGVAIFH